LCDRRAEFANLNTRVLVISFATLPAVQQWLKKTCPDITVLLDRERAVYRAYELERSFWRSRNLHTRWYYFKAWLAGKKAHNSHGDDSSQLGGDFIVDKNGLLRLIHPSRDPIDRPPVNQLLEVLKGF
jgi:alkyl hydroperoxide reductase subunit AhpC